MDPDWGEVARLQLPSSDYDAFGNGQSIGSTPNIGAIAFDTQQELFWVGDCHGQVTSYFNANGDLQRYTAFPAHPPEEGEVKQFLFDQKRVFSLASKSLHCTIRRGLTQWHTTHASMQDMACMTFLDRGDSILVAGSQGMMLKINVNNGVVIQEIPTTSSYFMMRFCRYICAATTTGSVNFLDPVTLEVREQWQAHNSKVADMDAKNDYLVTCGWTFRTHGAPAPDTIAKVYDLRQMLQIPPISFPAGASFVQIHPKMSTTCVVGSRGGQIQVVDIMNPDSPTMKIAQMHIVSLVMSPSGNVWALADQDNSVQIWGSPKKLNFNEHSEPTEFAAIVAPVPSMKVDSDLPLSTVGMPYYKENLLSAWGGEQKFEVGGLPPEVDPDLKHRLKHTRFGQMAEKHGKFFRNQVRPKTKMDLNGSSNSAPAPDGLGLYANVKIIYGQRGIVDFDFQQYNNTGYSGLEGDIQHSFLNPLLQLLKYTPSTRNAALEHVAGNCLAPDCLLCELGFLLDNLEKAGGINCQATNFLNTYGSLNLLKDSGGKNLDVRIVQAANALLLRLVQDSHRMQDSLGQVLTTNAHLDMHCMKCGTQSHRLESSYLLNLIYSDQVIQGRRQTPTLKFSDVLSQSFLAASQGKGWCNYCKGYPPLSQQRLFGEIPPLLIVNALPDRDHQICASRWATPGWLPQSVGVFLHQTGHVTCTEENLEQMEGRISVYDLVGVVAQIHSAKDRKSHLVSLIDVSMFEPSSEPRRWHLFNDFAVQEVTKEEALHFDPAWKTPVLLAYQARPLRQIDDTWKRSLDPSCLWTEGSLDPDDGFPLQPTEEQQPGYVAIDAEFVRLQNEEYEMTFEGKRKTIKPKRQAIGRVSALRVGGPNDSVPFIDDYIQVSEEIVSYETQFSGLEVGDLELGRSRYALQSLKVIYRKLWLLLNLGFTFIGHGLASDFRVLNLIVPDSQIVDTVKIFCKPDQRLLSLRFLAWGFLAEEIQTGNHDSIIDARTALRLWRRYQELEQSGIFAEELTELYLAGHRTKYLPPQEYNAMVQAQKQGRSRGGGLEVGGLPSGRLTPEQGGGGGSAAGSAPVTPEPRGRGRGRGRDEGYFASPLK